MRLNKTTMVIFFSLLAVSCANTKKEKDIAQLSNKFDTYLSDAMQLHRIPGLALAVVQGDEVVYETYLGKASLEDDRPVDEHTLFRIFSATKLITTTGIFQLVQSGALRLDDPISKYLEVPLSWHQVEVQHLLTHSSGIPNFVRYKSSLSDSELMSKLSADDMEFVTGNQFSYNQTNYWLLAQLIENITGMRFDQYILKNQFGSSKEGVLFSSNSQDTLPNRAPRYKYNSKTDAFDEDVTNNGVRGHAGNGLNITLNTFVEWNKGLDTHELLDAKTKSKMWSPFPYANQKDHFLHGWGSYFVNNQDSYGFSGGNLAAFRKFPESDMTIIMLSNGYKIPAYDIIVNDIARLVLPELRNQKETLEYDVMRLVLNHEFEKALQSYAILKEENPNSEFDNLKSNINTIGNFHVWEDELEKAYTVFRFNAAAHPDWWISSASLAETNEMQNDTLAAIKNYEKAISLNINNEYGYNEQMRTKIQQLKNN